MGVGEMWWNVFASKACQFLRALGSVMVLIVLGLVGLTYYTTVSLVYGPLAGTDTNDGRFATAVLVIYHVLILMVLWSYFACVLTEPGKVPDGWTPPAEDEEAALGKSNSEKLRRFCRKCSAWKPERCHHCSVCGRCVLKMDHHCVWVANCVGAYNYKFFLLFLLYTFVATIFDAVVLLGPFVDFFRDLEASSHGGGGGVSNSGGGADQASGFVEVNDELNGGQQAGRGGGMAAVFVTFVLDVAFAASLLGFIIMHANLNLSNMTTIEMYEKKKTLPWRYNVGARKNFEEVFGKNPWLWFLPYHSTDQLRRLLDISRLSGGTYPEMRSDGLDPAGEPTRAGDSPRGMPPGNTCAKCI